MKKLICLFSMLFLLCSCGSRQKPGAEVGTFRLTFLTIGKGDAFLLTSPDERHYLLDTGKAEDYIRIARTLREKEIDTLEGIFLTHGHKDHAGCLEPLLRAFQTKQVYVSGLDAMSYAEIDPRAIAAAQGVPVTELYGGEVLDLGGVTAYVWLPPEADWGNANNHSMILRLVHGDNAFLMMGDAEKEEELAFLASGTRPQAQLLKLGHHGEDDATSPLFLKEVHPEIGLITGNQEENPESVNDLVTDILEKQGVTAYYSEGETMEFVSDGSTIEMERLPGRKLPQRMHLSFVEVDRKRDVVTICNDGKKTAQLTGCTLISQRGNEIYQFPSGTTLEPGKTLTIACLDSSVLGDLIWKQKDVWKKHGDTASLYDRNFNLLAEDVGEP